MNVLLRVLHRLLHRQPLRQIRGNRGGQRAARSVVVPGVHDPVRELAKIVAFPRVEHVHHLLPLHLRVKSVGSHLHGRP